MNTMIKAVCILMIAIGCTNLLNAQDSAKIAAVKNAITNRHYYFEAESVLPQRGETKQLTPDYYEVQVRNDSIISDLPFYGRVYIAPLNSDDAGIKFTSVKFDYNIQQKKKGACTIVIKPKDLSNVQELDFDISESGAATLTVASNDKETISYNGYIKY